MPTARIQSRIRTAICAAVMLSALGAAHGQAPGQTALNPRSIPQFVEPLPHFAGHRAAGPVLTVSASEIQQKVLPAQFYSALPAPYKAGTYVWAYDVNGMGALYPGFTFEASRGVPVIAQYSNNLPISGSVVQRYLQTDQTLKWANPFDLVSFLPYAGPPMIVAHLHGGEVPSDFDGGPDQWYTPDGIRGPGYRTLAGEPTPLNGAAYRYPNDQEPAALWFHDHGLGATRLNVFAGLAAFYLIRDWSLERPDLPGGPNDSTVTEPGRAVFADQTYKPEIELAIQDRMFDTNGQWYFPSDGVNPTVHPFWVPEFFGDVMVVNGKSWPYLRVEPRRYRFRVLDGCNARFLRMWLQDPVTHGYGPTIYQIGSDGGLLPKPARLSAANWLAPSYLFLAPGERADVIIDFSAFAGRTLNLVNNARSPFPNGDPVDQQTTGRIMQFRVGTVITGNGGVDPSYNPARLASPRLVPLNPVKPETAVVKRQLTLNEVMAEGGPLEVLVNNTKYSGRRAAVGEYAATVPIPGFTPNLQGDLVSELPTVGTTEIWEIINLTEDAHPMHLHLTQFQLVSRRKFNVPAYEAAYASAFTGGWDFSIMMNIPPGMFVPAFGPPRPYNSTNADGAVGGNPAIGPYMTGATSEPLPEETGWKDTIKVYPGQVTRLAVRFTKQNGQPFDFDATGATMISTDRGGNLVGGPGYVWHCHIVDHEDNEMMRPLLLRRP